MIKGYKINTCISIHDVYKLTAIWEEPKVFNSPPDVYEFICETLISMHSNTWQPKYMSELVECIDYSDDVTKYINYQDELNTILSEALKTGTPVTLFIDGRNCLITIGIFISGEYKDGERVHVSIEGDEIETEVVHYVSTDI